MFIEVRLLLRRHKHLHQDGVRIIRHVNRGDTAIIFDRTGVRPKDAPLDDHVSAVPGQISDMYGFAADRLCHDPISRNRPLIASLPAGRRSVSGISRTASVPADRGFPVSSAGSSGSKTA